MKKKKVLFPQDNALCYKLTAMMAKLHKLHFELLLHPPYSPDLAPSNYWPFADLKRMRQGKIWLQWRSDIRNWGVFLGWRQTIVQKKKKKKKKKASNCLRSVEICVSPKKETMLMNKIEFFLKTVIFLVRPGTY